MRERVAAAGSSAPVTLRGVRDARLTLRVTHHDAPGHGLSDTSDRASQPYVELEVELDGRGWRASGALLTSTDLAGLAGWVRRVAAGRLTDPFEAVEPGFGVTGRRHGDTVLLRLRLSHALAPPFPDADPEGLGEGAALRLRLGLADAGALADHLAAWQEVHPPP